VQVDGRRLRLHDYPALFAVPGLYEAVVQDALRCRAPEVVATLLAGAAGGAPLRVADLGAGNGVSGEALRVGGLDPVVALDLLPEARDAALRDRPDAYAEFVAGDVGEPGLVAGLVERYGLNAVACSGGISHIPVEAFAEGWSAFPSGSWLVATAAEDMGDPEEDVYGRWVAGEVAEGRLADVYTERFVHRLSMSGEPIEYTALRARKT
jgi:hypothetical protein